MRVRNHFRSNVIGYVALFVALSGTAYAANTIASEDIINGEVKSVDIATGGVNNSDIADNAVGAPELDNNAVRSVDLRDGDVGSIDITDESLVQEDLAPNSVGFAEIQTDAVQATEIIDGAIDSGEIVDNSLFATDLGANSVHASELGTITRRSQASAPIAAGANGSAAVACNAGERVISGGNDGFFDVFVVASRTNGNGWAVFVHNNSGVSRTITVHAECLAI